LQSDARGRGRCICVGLSRRARRARFARAVGLELSCAGGAWGRLSHRHGIPTDLTAFRQRTTPRHFCRSKLPALWRSARWPARRESFRTATLPVVWQAVLRAAAGPRFYEREISSMGTLPDAGCCNSASAKLAGPDCRLGEAEGHVRFRGRATSGLRPPQARGRLNQSGVATYQRYILAGTLINIGPGEHLHDYGQDVPRRFLVQPAIAHC